MNDREMKELLELTRDNNKLLRKMRRHAIFGNVTRLIYWAIIFGVPVVLYYYFLQPYLGDLMNTYDSVKGGAESIQNIGNQAEGLGGLLEQFGIGR
jgi:hypothetical protein